MPKKTVNVKVDNNSLLCPSCLKMDGVRKVSDIYNEGVSKTSVELTHGQEGNIPENADIRSSLAKRLTPHVKPLKPGNNLLFLIVFTIGLAGYWLWSFFISYDDYTKELVQGLFGPWWLWILILAFIALVAGGEYYKRVKAYNNQEEIWQKGKLKWDKLYYCSRCNGVFTRSENQFIPINDIGDYLSILSPIP